MAPSSGVWPALQQFRQRLISWDRTDPHATVKLVAAVTLFALLLRLAFLGQRVAHFDEGRVAYWALHFSDTGNFAYRRIIHGPFIQHADQWLFGVLGPSDFTMRLPVAVVGGLLPLTALLLRRHLDRTEVVVLSLLFAVNPVLLYYSRFMRSDVLVAVFMFTGFALLVRLYDTRRARYMYAAAVFLAFGFASKENALVYVITWLGATGLLLAKRIFLPRGFRDAVLFITDTPSGAAIAGRLKAGVKRRVRSLVALVRSFRARHERAWLVASTYLAHVLFALGLFALVSLYFYAPRGTGLEGLRHPPATSAETVGFWQGMTDPSMFEPLVRATTDRVVSEWGEWLEPADGKGLDTYLRHFGVFVDAFAYASGPLAAFAGLGYVLDRLGYTTPRHLIPFLFYAGFVSIFGYPLGTDIGAPWIVTHAVVPLAVPAAVAVTWVFRIGSDAVPDADEWRVGMTTIVFFVAAALVLNAGVTMVYTNTTDGSNPLVQFAQPEQDLRQELEEVQRLAAENDEGADVVMYHGLSGGEYDSDNAYVGENRDDWNSSFWNTQPTCMMWYNSLPTPWYIASGEMDVDCENRQSSLGETAMEDQPPVIITQTFDTTVPSQRLEVAGYSDEEYQMRTSGSRNVVTVWTLEDSANNSTTR